MKISITRALAELKLLDSRINNKIGNVVFIADKKKSSSKINNTYTIEEFESIVQSDHQSITDLINRRRIIKSKIVESNAKTIVDVDGEKMTVADAIERKSSIEYERNLLDTMKRQLARINHKVTEANDRMELNLDRQLEAMMNSDGKKTDGMKKFSEEYREQNGYEVIDPLKLNKLVKELEEKIENFEMNVDFVLSESNSRNTIEIPD
ncbi:hypothetical protein CF086_16890 [Clostridium botulinum]|uniref:hypothetical protein n=1 Tax=Clostridium botulinum TaxID=1491 RepID=UPI001969E537|nr:hypothetical protein [Clostridium botulinum]MBN3351972.1 hypothetical protein [Clostridium botulinum]